MTGNIKQVFRIHIDKSDERNIFYKKKHTFFGVFQSTHKVTLKKREVYNEIPFGKCEFKCHPPTVALNWYRAASQHCPEEFKNLIAGPATSNTGSTGAAAMAEKLEKTRSIFYASWNPLQV